MCDRSQLAEEAKAYAQAVAKRKSEIETNRLLANPKPDKFNAGPGSLIGLLSDHHLCIDCGFNTASGCVGRIETELDFMDGADSSPMTLTWEDETYMVRDKVWRAAGMGPWDGCLCVGCLEKRIGRRLRPKDFTDHVFNSPLKPASERLRQRRGGQCLTAIC
jgi:hypothetical protein